MLTLVDYSGFRRKLQTLWLNIKKGVYKCLQVKKGKLSWKFRSNLLRKLVKVKITDLFYSFNDYS